MIDVQQQLDEVIRLNQERQQAMTKIHKSTHKSVGRCLLELSPNEKQQALNKVQKFYNIKIDEIYQGINKELEAAGQPLLNNPF